MLKRLIGIQENTFPNQRKRKRKKTNFGEVNQNLLFYIYNRMKVVSLVFLFLSCLWLSIFSYVNLCRYFRGLIPINVEVKIPSQEVSQNISLSIKSILKKAHDFHYDRVWITRRIKKVLNSERRIDQYWLRYEPSDATVEIFASLHIPEFYIQDSHQNKYLVSTDYKIIEKNPKASDLEGLPLINLNHFKFSNQVFPHVFQLQDSHRDDVGNLSWIRDQTFEIYRIVSQLKPKYRVENLSFHVFRGFIVELRSTDMTKNVIYQVVFGKEFLKNYPSRFIAVIKNLESKGISNAYIDLTYSNKTIVKIIRT